VEGHLINNLLGNDIRLFWFRQTKGLPYQGGIHGVSKLRLIVHDDKVKEGLQLSVPVILGGLGIILGEYVQELK